MRSAALIALLPLLATSSVVAHKHGHEHGSHHVGHVRKSLSFGPAHAHASFDIVDPATQVAATLFTDEPVDARAVAARFIADRLGKAEGEGFYIREDTHTDARTYVTHVYARQLLNGLEVSDGDINLNIDRDGRILSIGDSFHPGDAPAAFGTGPSGERDKICATLHATIDAHKEHLDELKAVGADKGVWGVVKAAAQVVLGGTSDAGAHAERDEHAIHQARKEVRRIKHHLRAVCGDTGVPALVDGFATPVDALASLMPRLASKAKGKAPTVNVADLTSTPHHSLAPKHAPAEPPTEIISGPALAQAGIVNDVPARLMYTQTSVGAPRLVWKLEVEMKDNWYESYVDVETGEILRIVDWASDSPIDHFVRKDDVGARKGKGGDQKPLPSPPTKIKPYSYQVFPWGVNDPSTGNVTVVHKPWDEVASPLGWHDIPTAANPWAHAKIDGAKTKSNMTNFETTAGNNVIAHEDWEGQNQYLNNYRPVNSSHVFVYDYGEPDGLAPKEYVDLVVTQLFYTSNVYHDLLYRLGFDEISGNFQAYNFDKGGKGGDPVTANAQDGSGYNNANFMTPPDGQAPRMRMYVWDTATPWRDGDLEAGIVIHEYSHGLSTRLTGGPANSGCLGYGEAGGMGEGWGDAIATLIRQIEEHKLYKNGSDVYSMGAWAANEAKGIRNYRYSTNSTTNPSTYKTLDRPGYWGVHAIGEVWAEHLFVLSQRLVEKYGFGTTLFPPTDPSKPNEYYVKTMTESVDALGRPAPLVPKHGNTLALQLIIDAMKLQPCRPSFFDARNAIIQADSILTGGENECLIWAAFAERGLGQDASVVGQTPWGGGVRNDGFKVPKTCKE
ncbi:hypothetical protein Q5752_002156 [Cryptotrichosporon argae]